ncbi:hypothetical protein ACFLXD_01705 [Chloroflexota bacterium]
MNNLNKNPYLSIIIASRNDDHGGNLLRRMQVSLSGLLEQLEKHRIESELIMVEWNPPADKPSLKDVIKWPVHLRYCTVRLIIVPNSIHQRYRGSDKMPMIREVAVNCGIRRARGQFILPGAIDLLYSEKLMSYIAARSLRGDEEYRIDRSDVDKSVVQFNTLKEQLEYCKKNTILVHSHAPPAPRRWWQGSDLPVLHTSAAGDFQLLSRRYWHLLRGYSEDFLFAYGDGLFCYMACAAGVREVVLTDPLCLYHIDHSGKFNERTHESVLPFENWLTLSFLPKKFNNYILRLYRIFLTTCGYKLKGSVGGIPTLHFAEYWKMVEDVVAGRRSYIFNDENWGLGQESLEEFVISCADWDKEYCRN